MNAVDYFSNKYSGITPKNSNLTKAKAAKNDEFYTQYSDIEAELSHYEVKHFADRVLYLPCDDWHFSQFVKYFEDNFTRLQLKALVATGINFSGAGYYYKKTSEGVITRVLDCNGDFRSDACRQLMKEADIIVTNPPFSLFREFVAQIMEFRKQFIILGNMNAITYKEFFPLLKDNKVWVGTKRFGGGMDMIFPKMSFDEGSVKNYKVSDNGDYLVNIMGVIWYTNIDLKKRHEPLQLSCTYSESAYPKYDNYDAIEVSKVDKIPCDYFGVMGVPITFIGKYCPDQFEILWQASGNTRVCCPEHILYDELHYVKNDSDRGGAPVLNGKLVYSRILIKRKTIHVEPE